VGFVLLNLHVFFSGVICGPFDFISFFFFLGHCYDQNIRPSINVSSKLDLVKQILLQHFCQSKQTKNNKIFDVHSQRTFSITFIGYSHSMD
jgi:hypothetical protein